MSKKQLAIIISAVAIICLFALVPSVWQNVYWTHVLILTMISVILAAAFRTFMRTGMLSLGTAGFMLLGAYSSALMTKSLGFSFWAALPLGGLAAAVAALIVGVPFLRAKGLFFAILTFLMSEGFRLVAWYWTSVTGGSTGLLGIPDPNPINLFGLFTITFDTRFSYFYLVLFIAVISLLILYLIERSWYGLTWSALRESENLAQAVGINVMGHKLMMFAITSFFMGIAGVLYAHYMGALSPFGTPGSVFSMTNSLYILTVLSEFLPFPKAFVLNETYLG